jgi:membrane protease YdiL (CAAX protease family)
LIWGLWHIPVILQGHNYPEAPVLGIFLMTVFTVLLGAFLSWLYFKTGSPWAPALGHGSVNAVAALSVIFFSEVNITYGATLTSVSGLIVLVGVVGGMYLTGKLPAEISEHVSRETLG